MGDLKAGGPRDFLGPQFRKQAIEDLSAISSGAHSKWPQETRAHLGRKRRTRNFPTRPGCSKPSRDLNVCPTSTAFGRRPRPADPFFQS